MNTGGSLDQGGLISICRTFRILKGSGVRGLRADLSVCFCSAGR